MKGLKDVNEGRKEGKPGGGKGHAYINTYTLC